MLFSFHSNAVLIFKLNSLITMYMTLLTAHISRIYYYSSYDILTWKNSLFIQNNWWKNGIYVFFAIILHNIYICHCLLSSLMAVMFYTGLPYACLNTTSVIHPADVSNVILMFTFLVVCTEDSFFYTKCTTGEEQNIIYP